MFGGMGRMIGFMLGLMFGIEALKVIISVRGMTPIAGLIGATFVGCLMYAIYVFTME
jgi:hypothetical protein